MKFKTLFPVCWKTALNLICSTVLLVSPDTPVLHGAKHEHSQNQWQNLKGYSQTSFYGASAGFNSLSPSNSYHQLPPLYHTLSWGNITLWRLHDKPARGTDMD